MNKFKVGDEVRIVNTQPEVQGMLKYLGRTATVRKARDGWYLLSIDSEMYDWHEDWLDYSDYIQSEINIDGILKE